MALPEPPPGVVYARWNPARSPHNHRPVDSPSSRWEYERALFRALNVAASGAFLPLVGGALTGQLEIPAGSVGAPSIYFTGSPTSGYYSPGTDRVGLAAGGASVLNAGATAMGVLGSTGLSANTFTIGAAGATDKFLRLESSNASSYFAISCYGSYHQFLSAGVYTTIFNSLLGDILFYPANTLIAKFRSNAVRIVSSSTTNPTADYLEIGHDAGGDRYLKMHSSVTSKSLLLSSLSTLQAVTATDLLKLDAPYVNILCGASGTAQTYRFEQYAARMLSTSTSTTFAYLDIGSDGEGARYLRIYGQNAGYYTYMRTQSAGFEINSTAKIKLISSSDILFYDAGTYVAQFKSGRFLVGTSGTALGMVAIDQNSTTAAVPVLHLDQADEDQAFIDFVGTEAADFTKNISSATPTASTTKWLRVEISGTTYWLSVVTSA